MTFKLTPLVEGNDHGETIVFIQGWPDDATLWDPTVAALRDRYRCVRVNMPNYGGDRSTRWGYETNEILDALETYVADAGRGKPVTLVLHDWGSYWGNALHNRRPELASRVATLDVAPHLKLSWRSAPPFIAYQWWLLGAFVAGGATGDAMTRAFARLAHAPAESSRITAWMNYPYRNVWEDLASGRIRELYRGYWPTCPLLFVYGENKPFHFHSRAWTDHVRAVGGEVVGLPCNHWVPRDPAFVGVLDRWLTATAPRIASHAAGAPSA